MCGYTYSMIQEHGVTIAWNAGGGGTDFTLHFIFNRGGYLIPWLHCVVYILYCIYIDWDLCGLSNLGKSRPGGGNRNQEEEVQFRKEEDRSMKIRTGRGSK